MDQPISAQQAGTITIGNFEVNRLGFGAMRLTGKGIWGAPVDWDGAKAVLRRAVELGVDFFDTADSYGPNVSEGIIAETLIPYEGLVVATKGGMLRPGPGDWHVDCSPAHLREALEGSMQRLGVEQVQLYQLHSVDPRVPFEMSLQALIDMRADGKIKHIGLCNVEPEQLRQAMELTEIVSVQNKYNIANREHEDVLKLCEENGLAFISYFPLGAGTLTAPDGPLSSFAAKYNATPAQIALAWLLAHSRALLPIPGTSSIEHLEENISAATLELKDEDVEALNNLAV